MIAAVVLRGLRRVSRCLHRLVVRTVALPKRTVLRRLPLRVHVWGMLLPPWPNYGASRVGAKSRR